MKIITNQITNKDIINKSRHLTGLHRWSRSSKMVGFIMLVVEWFTIPFEVVFRRDFGQRWLTTVNFFAGAFLILIFFTIQDNWHFVTGFFNVIWIGIVHLSNPLSAVPDNSGSRINDDIAILVLAGLFFCYLLLGTYQLFKIKWRNQVNLSVHSFDDGTSRLRWLAAILAWVLNLLATPLMVIFWLMLPVSQRKGKPFPKLIHDHEVFTNTCIEPGIVIFLAFELANVTSFYFFLSGIALFLHAHWKEMARKSKVLDFQDGKIEAAIMKELRNAQNRSDTIVKKAKANMRQQSQQAAPPIVVQYPNLADIIGQMHHEKLRASVAKTRSQFTHMNFRNK